MEMCIRDSGEELVVGVRGDEVGLRREEFQPDEAGKRAADEEEEGDGDQIQDRDALVVAGEEPTEQAVLRVDEVAAGELRGALVGKIENRGTRCAHGFTTPDA